MTKSNKKDCMNKVYELPLKFEKFWSYKISKIIKKSKLSWCENLKYAKKYSIEQGEQKKVSMGQFRELLQKSGMNFW